MDPKFPTGLRAAAPEFLPAGPASQRQERTSRRSRRSGGERGRRRPHQTANRRESDSSKTYSRKSSRGKDPLEEPRGDDGPLAAMQATSHVDSRDSRRRRAKPANHLLNFSYAEHDRQRKDAGSVYNRRHRPITHRQYSRDEYLLSTYRFGMMPAAANSYISRAAADPDTPVPWSDVAVVFGVGERPLQCPISLEAPIAPRITRCGHVFSLPHILRYLQFADSSCARCPCCFFYISERDLRRFDYCELATPAEGETADFVLVRRFRGSVVANRADAARSAEVHDANGALSSGDDHQGCAPTACDAAAAFTKVCSVDDMAARISEELDALGAARAYAVCENETEVLPLIERAAADAAAEVAALLDDTAATGAAPEHSNSANDGSIAQFAEEAPQQTHLAMASDGGSLTAAESLLSPPPGFGDISSGDSTPPYAGTSRAVRGREHILSGGTSTGQAAVHGRRARETHRALRSLAGVSASDFLDDLDDFVSEDDMEDYEGETGAAHSDEEGYVAEHGSSGPRVPAENGDAAAGKGAIEEAPSADTAVGSGRESPTCVCTQDPCLRSDCAERARKTETDASPGPGSAAAGADASAFHFYQDMFGRYIFLDPINVKMMVDEYGSYASLPYTLTAPIISVEILTLSEEKRKRFGYLTHVPKYATVHMLELDLSGIVSAAVQSRHAAALEKRARQRAKLRRDSHTSQGSEPRAANSPASSRSATLHAEMLAAARWEGEAALPDAELPYASNLNAIASFEAASFGVDDSGSVVLANQQQALARSSEDASFPALAQVSETVAGAKSAAGAEQADSSGRSFLSALHAMSIHAFENDPRQENWEVTPEWRQRSSQDTADGGGRKKKGKKKSAQLLFSNSTGRRY